VQTIFESRPSGAVRTSQTPLLGSADASPSVAPLPPAHEPERKLLGAILQDAIECWQALAPHPIAIYLENARTPMGKRQRNYREAHFWFFGDYDNAPYFSFTTVCDGLGLDPEFIRRCLLEWKRNELQRLGMVSY
jgi:hypothetical protein